MPAVVRLLTALVVVTAGVGRVPAAHAQDALGASLSGYVVDTTGARVPAAVVTATPVDARPARQAVADETGYYILRALEPARYAVSAAAPAGASAARDVDIRAAASLRADHVIQVGPVSETVVVSGDPPLLEWQRPTHAIAISGTLQRDLPGSSLRTWSDFLLNVPAAVATQARFQTYGVYGTAPGSGAILVDGADATSVIQGSTLYAQFADETFADIAVATAGKDLSAPLGLGPLSRIITRSGSDVGRGSISIAAQARSWNASNTPNGQDQIVETRQVDGVMGGPLARGRAWAFGSLRVARNGTGVPRSAQQLEWLRLLAPEFEPFVNDWRGQAGFAKLTAAAGPRHTLTASVTHDVMRYGGAQPNEAALFRDIVAGGPGAFGRMMSAWSSRLLTTASINYNGRAQRTRNRAAGTTGVTLHEGVFGGGGRLFGTGTRAVVEASPFPGLDFDVHLWTLAADATYAARGRTGEHELSGGVLLQPRRRDRRVTTYNNGGFQLEERVLLPGAAGGVPFHRQVFDSAAVVSTFVDASDTAVYVQDAWRPASGLTVTAGLRADVIRRRDRLFDVVTQRSVDVSRRLGAALALDANAHRVVYASWGRAYDNLSVNPIQAGTNIGGSTDLYDVDLNGTFETAFVTPPRLAQSSNIVLALDRLHQPHADEILGGLRQQLNGWLRVDVGALRRTYGRPTALEVNAVYAGAAFAGYADETQNEIYRITENVWNWPVVTALEVAASARHPRVEAIASLSRQWNRLAGTWQPNDPASRLQPDAFANSGGIGSVSGCTAGGVFCPDADGYSSLSSSGTWRAYVAHGAVSYRAPWRIHLALSTTIQSGPWSGPVLTRLAAADPGVGPAIVTLGNGRQVSNPLATLVRFAQPTRAAGQLRVPALILANVRLSHSLPIGGCRLENAIDVLNLLNRGSDQAFQPGAQQLAGPVFGQTAVRQFPRGVLATSRVSC